MVRKNISSLFSKGGSFRLAGPRSLLPAQLDLLTKERLPKALLGAEMPPWMC